MATDTDFYAVKGTAKDIDLYTDLRHLYHLRSCADLAKVDDAHLTWPVPLRSIANSLRFKPWFMHGRCCGNLEALHTLLKREPLAPRNIVLKEVVCHGDEGCVVVLTCKRTSPTRAERISGRVHGRIEVYPYQPHQYDAKRDRLSTKTVRAAKRAMRRFNRLKKREASDGAASLLGRLSLTQ